MKNTKGITLVALVISIIVMMILVGVTVTIALKGNLFNTSKKTTTDYTGQQIKEMLTPILTNVVINNGIDILKTGNESTFQKELNKEIDNANDTAEVYYDYYGDKRLVSVLYRKYVCRINRGTGEIVEVFKADIKYTGNGIDLDNINPDEMNAMAKEIEYKFKTLDGQGLMTNGYNVVYSDPNPMKTGKHEGSGEQEWMSGDENPIKLVTEIYCANNVMIYDGTNPYIPVMVRFYRDSKGSGTLGNKPRGLKYFRVNEEKMDFSTKHENGDWAFVDNSNYNYEADSDRKCASNTASNTSFNDKKAGDYWASGRLTYTNQPTDILTELGSFQATSADQDGNNERNLEVGSNYVVDVREYYSTIENGKNLLNVVENTTSVSTEYYNLSRAIVDACTFNYEYNYPGMFAKQIEEKTAAIKTAIDNLNKAVSDNIAQVSDVVLATVKKAQEAEMTIPTLEINGGYNIVYSDPNPMKTGKHEGSGEQQWKSKSGLTTIKMVVEGYCANNVMIYDGTNPYVPVMVRFYRSNDGTNNKYRGLNYFRVSEEKMDFSTKNENGDWEFVGTSEYNYEADSDNRDCSSNTNSTSSFNDKKAGDYWASGRLTYTNQPTDILTELGSFQATSADQDGNNQKTVEVGSNYVVDVTEYYSKINEAKSLITKDNLYNKSKSEAVHDLAKIINEIKDQTYTFNNAQDFADEIQNNINKLDTAIQKLK